MITEELSITYTSSRIFEVSRKRLGRGSNASAFSFSSFRSACNFSVRQPLSHSIVWCWTNGWWLTHCQPIWTDYTTFAFAFQRQCEPYRYAASRWRLKRSIYSLSRQLPEISNPVHTHTQKSNPGHREQGDDIDNILFCQESEFVWGQTRLKDLWQCHLECRVPISQASLSEYSLLPVI